MVGWGSDSLVKLERMKSGWEASVVDVVVGVPTIGISRIVADGRRIHPECVSQVGGGLLAGKVGVRSVIQTSVEFREVISVSFDWSVGTKSKLGTGGFQLQDRCEKRTGLLNESKTPRFPEPTMVNGEC
jgi:hypothetical protein